MPATRLPFAIEDLELEIRKVCGGHAHITIELEPLVFTKVVAELKNHNEKDLSFPLAQWGRWDEAKFRGITLATRETDARPPA